MKKIILSLGLILFLALLYHFFFTPKKTIDITVERIKLPEDQRVRYFKEIGMDGVREQYYLTGKGVSIAVMGEAIDPNHPDIQDRIHKQYDTYDNKTHSGKENLPYHYDVLKKGDGHGTHIAGIIAAKCDGIGIQGIACDAMLDVYSFGRYDEPLNINGQTKFIKAFSRALDNITKEGSIKITTGSFNIESPAINYKKDPALYGKPAVTIMRRIIKETDSFNDLIKKKIISFKNSSDISYIQSFEKTLDIEEFNAFALGSLFPFSKEWHTLIKSIHDYQASGGVYLVTESNIVLSKTSLLNAMPSMHKEVDKDLWLSVVMVAPKGIEKVNTQKEFDAALRKGEYVTPLNNCGEMAREYCILTPSYDVLSTMTPKVADPQSITFIIEGRTYQVFSGHSMGAPMVAGALALLQEYNQKEHMGYTMKDLVRILKQSANRAFKGYDPKKHGQGILDIKKALETMKK